MPRPTEYRVSWHFTLRKDKIKTLVEKINFFQMVLLFVFFFCKIRSDIPISVKAEPDSMGVTLILVVVKQAFVAGY